jgi:hypothetical protein
MKNRYFILLPALLLTLSAMAQLPSLVCPNSYTANFSAVPYVNFTPKPNTPLTTCQKVVVLEKPTDTYSEIESFTTTFGAGSPVPTSLPAAPVSTSTALYRITTPRQIVALGQGQTVITVTGSNNMGLIMGSCTYTITLVDDVPPDFTGSPRGITLKTPPAMPDLRSLMSVTENCGYTLSQTPAPGSPVSGASVDVTFLATDGNGNVSLPWAFTLNLTNTTPYDALSVVAVGGCTGTVIGRSIEVAIRGLAANAQFYVTYRVDGNNPGYDYSTSDANGEALLYTPPVAANGPHVVTLLGIQKQVVTVPNPEPFVFLDRILKAYVGNLPSLGAVSVEGPLCDGSVYLAGNTLTISVQDIGAHYQWYKDGTPITGANAPKLTLPAAQDTDSGDYYVVASNYCGGINSATRSLSVGTLQVTVVIVLPNGAGTSPLGRNTDLTLPPGGTIELRATGGVSYDWRQVVDRVAGYEIRQSEQNSSGIFRISRTGSYQLVMQGTNGCERVLTGLVQQSQ